MQSQAFVLRAPDNICIAFKAILFDVNINWSLEPVTAFYDILIL